MKKNYLLLFALIMTTGIYAQMGIKLQIGGSPAKTQAGVFNIDYVDESPSRDHLQQRVNLNQKNMGITIGLELDYVTESNLYFEGGFELLTSSPITGFEFNFGAGYQLGSDKLYFRPGILFAVGSAGVKLGDLYQNDVYIEVNRTQFYSESVSIELSRGHFIAIPKVEFAMPVADTFELIGDIGYQLPLSIKSNKLVFFGQDQDNKDVSAEESIFAENVYLSLDGERINSNFVGVDGFAFNIGIRYIIE